MTSATISFAHLSAASARLLSGQPDRRPDVARHQRPGRRAHDGRAGRHVLRQHGARVRDRRRRHVLDRLRLTLVALLPLPGVTLATRYFGQRHSRPVRADPGPALRHERRRPGGALRRARRQGLPARKRPSSTRFRRANDEYVERNRRLIRLQAAFYPSLTLCFGLSGLLVLWVGGRRRHARAADARRVRRVQPLPRAASWPLIAFGWVINIVQRGVASWERMLEVLDAPPAARWRRIAAA